MYNTKLYWTLSLLASPITGCISISTFASLLGIPIGTTSSAIGLNISAIATGNKKYNSIVKEKKKYDKSVRKIKLPLSPTF